MQDEKWQQLVEAAQKHFKNVSLTLEDLIMDTQDGPIKSGTQDVLIFENPSGRYRLIRENKPVVLEKKELYSHRAGQSAQTQYKFSETEFSHKLKVYKEVDFDEWEEVTLDKLGL
ncbi:MAG TPA: hypothetical protein VE973_00165 [Candidatus Limnocylindria bacterium]|nr:hypothetical protein [Candidatus Limnocylindria bacterium]